MGTQRSFFHILHQNGAPLLLLPLCYGGVEVAAIIGGTLSGSAMESG